MAEVDKENNISDYDDVRGQGEEKEMDMRDMKKYMKFHISGRYFCCYSYVHMTLGIIDQSGIVRDIIGEGRIRKYAIEW